VAIAAAIFYRWRQFGFDWAEFARTFRGVRPGWLAASIVAGLATYLGRVLRWQVMLRPIRAGSSTWNLLSATAIGFTSVVFFGRMGELVRPYLIAKKENVPFSSQMAAWLLERVLDLLMVLLIFGIALIQVPRTGLTPGPNMQLVLQAGGVILGVAGALCLVMLLIFRNFSDSAQRRLMEALTFLPAAYQARIDRVIGAFSTGLGATRGSGALLLLLFYSVVEWVLIILCFVFLFQAFPAVAQFSLVDVTIFLGFVSIGSAIQIPGIGGGMQVAAVLVLTELFGQSLESATSFALVLWAVSFATIVPFGMVLAFMEGLSWRNLSHVSEEAA
jgi:glycosyltransferase 2 family protein